MVGSTQKWLGATPGHFLIKQNEFIAKPIEFYIKHTEIWVLQCHF
jgi:hypothetical protein